MNKIARILAALVLIILILGLVPIFVPSTSARLPRIVLGRTDFAGVLQGRYIRGLYTGWRIYPFEQSLRMVVHLLFSGVVIGWLFSEAKVRMDRQAEELEREAEASDEDTDTPQDLPDEEGALQDAIAHLDAGRSEESLELLWPMIEAGNPSQLVRFYYVVGLCRNREPSEAREQFMHLQVDPMPVNRRYRLAISLDGAGLYDLALPVYQGLMGVPGAPDDVESRYDRVNGILSGGGAEAFEQQLVTMVDDRYSNTEVLANGSMGVVFRAYDAIKSRDVAIKMLSPFMRKDPEAVKRFMREAQVLKSLSHVNLVMTYDVHTGTCPHYSMELLSGPTLANTIEQAYAKSHAMDKDQVRSITLQLLDCLDYCHEKGVVHRDIKPLNILVPERGLIRLLDFGVVKLDTGSNMTAVGSVLGTPAYMPPEQLEAQEVDHRVDLYACGIVIYEMMTGATPFQVDVDLAAHIRFAKYKPVSQIRDDVGADFDEFLATCIHPDREKRFASAKKMSAAFNRVFK